MTWRVAVSQKLMLEVDRKWWNDTMDRLSADLNDPDGRARQSYRVIYSPGGDDFMVIEGDGDAPPAILSDAIPQILNAGKPAIEASRLP